jgi:diguanylate cyclase (GGDEF)-like protein/PAS domain S-box-containing protein
MKKQWDGTERRTARLRTQAERHLADAPPANPMLPNEALLHDLQVHRIELEMQNEALRQAQVELEESRDRYVDLYDFAPVGYLTLSHQGLIQQINLTGAELLHEDRKGLVNLRFARFVAPADSDRWYRHFLATANHNESQSCDLALLRRDGSGFHARLNCRRLPGAAQAVRITLTDISAIHLAEEELRIAAIAFESQEGVMVTDSRGVIVRVNRAFTQLTGYEAAEAVGHTPALLKSGHQDRAFYEQMWNTLKEKKYWQGEIWNRRKNGKTYAEWLTISAVCTPDGEISHYVGTFSEITQNKEAEAKIHSLAYYDPLTSLPNRRLLYDRLGQAMAASDRNMKWGALLFLDLDNFKNLNDTQGHDVGDRLLVETAQRLQANMREGDTVARLGSDEFVVMLEDLSEDTREASVQAKLVGEKVRLALTHPYYLGDNEYHGGASIGIGMFRGLEVTIDELLKRADLAMYQAKNAGRNALRFFDPTMQAALDKRSFLESELHQALKRQQLHLYYQAQLDGARRVIGAEALLRWQHPVRGLVPPNDFIPLAEDTGLILAIGRWVLETACRQIKLWSAEPDTRELRLAVNVSARQFRQPGFVDEVRQVLAESGADPARLKIELTESIMLDSFDNTIAKMKEIKSLAACRPFPRCRQR